MNSIVPSRKNFNSLSEIPQALGSSAFSSRAINKPRRAQSVSEQRLIIDVWLIDLAIAIIFYVLLKDSVSVFSSQVKLIPYFV
jgi:hypothetical protein